MNKLRNNVDLSDIAKWRLAAAYTLIGRKDVANDLIFRASKNINSYNESSNTFGSKTRDEALILEALVLMNEYDEGKSLIDNITKKLASDDYLKNGFYFRLKKQMHGKFKIIDLPIIKDHLN